MRKLSDDEFESYKNLSGNCSTRCEEDLISVHLNEIDGIVDFDTLNNLKEFSKKIADLDEKINLKTIDLNNCTTATRSSSNRINTITTPTNNSGSSSNSSGINTTTIPTNNSGSNSSSNRINTVTTPTNNSGSSSNGINTITTPTNKSEKVQKDIDELMVKVVDLVETIMPPTFLESMLIIPRDKLDSYRLHKIVIAEYNKYIDEMCDNVKNISNNLTTDNKNYSFIKNNERRSKNSFPSLKNKLNEILLNHASEFGFKDYHQHQKEEDHHHHQQGEEDHYHRQQEEEDHRHHNHQEKKKILKKINKKKIKYMKKKLFKEFENYKKNNPNNINLDLKEYPPVEIKQIGKKIEDLKSVDSISVHYDLSKFQTIEGKY